MVRQLTSRNDEERSPFVGDVLYPDSDGKPMSDNTKQYLWIALIKEGLEWLFAHDPNVFVAGDLLWYPVEGNNKIRIGPDVLVAFGRPKGHRGSYQQWKEDNITPFGNAAFPTAGNPPSGLDSPLPQLYSPVAAFTQRCWSLTMHSIFLSQLQIT